MKATTETATPPEHGRQRVVIERVRPEIDAGRFPVKRVVGEELRITADIFADGHDRVAARLLHRRDADAAWTKVPMSPLTNDRWEAGFTPDAIGIHHYTIEGWVDHFATWRGDLRKWAAAGQDLAVDLLIGARLVEETLAGVQGADRNELQRHLDGFSASDPRTALAAALSEELAALMERCQQHPFLTRFARELSVVVDRPRALFGAWYELFPRSCATEPGKHATFRDCEARLPEIAAMGFDILYLPPIHPIGRVNRKGKNNQPAAGPDDDGSPWAIGSKEGGHAAVHPELGTLEDFERFFHQAAEHGLEIALDLAFQCSPDHPWVTEHPTWFKTRPDGTVQYAENPPKKYQDIFPINFESEDWRELWEGLRGVVRFWIDRGVRIFRVDNPHTKTFPFWEWLIGEIKRENPEVLFLAEAFTRPKVMYRLAKLGFSQSYTYFTWRNTKQELTQYLEEMAGTEVREYFRPNFWPNTPDILPEFLQYGERSAFVIRFVLAATLSSNYGIYGPVFELGVHEALGPGREEYLDSEKFQIRVWDHGAPGSLAGLIARVNRIRRENPALQGTWNLKFCEAENPAHLFYWKSTPDLENTILVLVSLDPFQRQAGKITLPLAELGIDPQQPYLVHDLLGDEKYIWQGAENHVAIDPAQLPARIFRVHSRLRRETDFDYFM